MKNVTLVVSIIIALGVGLAIGMLINSGNVNSDNSNVAVSNKNLDQATDTNSVSDEYTEMTINKCVAAGNCNNCSWRCYEEIDGVLNKGICLAFYPEYCSQEELNEKPKPNCGFIDKECVRI